MFCTVSISDLQKSPQKVLAQKNPLTFILSHNKKQGGIVNQDFMNFIEHEGLIEAYEDWVLENSFKKEKNEGVEILASQDFSKTCGIDAL